MKKSLYILLIAVLTILLSTCRKRPQLKIYNLELSEEIVTVTPYSATITANYSYPGEIPQIKVYTSDNSSFNDANETDAVLDGNTMTATVDGLSSDTKYYYRFRYSNGIDLIYTDTRDFVTEHAVAVPIVVTIPITSVATNSAVSGGVVSDNGGADIIEKGVCWSTTEQPTIDDSRTSDGTGGGAYVSTLTELLPNTMYHVRAYATNSESTGYGNELTFTTSASLAVLTTKEVTNVAQTSAICGGNITNSGGMDITMRGVCWSTEHNPTTNDQHTEDGMGIGEFDSELTNLIANVKYYVRAYATSYYGTSYGNEVEFSTQMGAPAVTTKSVTGITASSASCGGNVTNSGGGTVSARGVCWSTSQTPTISDSHTSDGTGVGEFTSSITGLSNNVTYYVRAYATNSNGISYGEERSFITQEGLAVLTTNNVTNVTATTATCGGEITDDGGFNITARGVCWSTSQDPTIADAHTSDGTGTGSFTSSLTSLSYNTTYYVRAYATNSKGTSYGDEKVFTTSKLAPTVTTAEATSVTTNSAVTGGNVTSDGGASVTARGVCWSTSQNPTISGNHTTDGNGTGEFTSSLTGLEENTTYYVRAYATNSEGTSYGSQKSFTTSQNTSLPSVTTYQVSDVTATTATCGGYVVSDGGATVTSRGVCWSTSHNPVLNTNYMTNDGSGTGEFSSSITGLSPNTTYYVRAYASNSAGTNYGEEKTFTTNDGMPVVTTAEVTGIAQTTAICGGNVLSDGNLTVSARGVCWSTSPNPMININYMTHDGSGTGEFVSNITGLSPNTTYYVKAYATNSAGTSYGEQKIFTTGNNAPTWTNGILPGFFSISSSEQVQFSQGNLQYQASTNTWRFAEHQWDYVGSDVVVNGNSSGTVVGSSNYYISSTYSGWIDMFGFGTSGYNHGAICYQPWSISQNDSDYYVYGDNYANLNSHTGKADWGYNPISNGGNLENIWRTLSSEEWAHIFYNRNTASGIRFAFGYIDDVPGVILLPDNWTASIYNLNDTNNDEASYSSNNISIIDWTSLLEPNGAVFLPAAGWRLGTDIYNVKSEGRYITSTIHPNGNNVVYGLDFPTNIVGGQGSYNYGRHFGLSVRLVYSSYTPAPTGAINGQFSVSPTKQVWFSQGNLQYQASSDTWRFAENQYDCIGADNANISSTNSGWIDLFGWGTSGWDNGNTYYHPWDYDMNDSLYGPHGQYHLTGSYANADWGVYNQISNGGNIAGQWRSLNNSEGYYVLMERNTASGIRYAKAKVNDMNGLILLPDNWNSNIYGLSNTNVSDASYDSNVISAMQWITIENAGAVFLPAAGIRYGLMVDAVGVTGYYWHVTCGTTKTAFDLYFSIQNAITGSTNRSRGISVRLVQDVE